MSKTHRSLSSSLEPLESRIAPASVSANNIGGVLKISALTGIGATIGLQQTGPSDFTLFDLSNAPIAFTGVKSVLINLSDLNDLVNFGTVDGVPAFKGPVTINTENSLSVGGDTITFNPGVTLGGTVVINSDGASTTTMNGARILGALKVTSPGGRLMMGGVAETVTTYELNYVSLENGADIKRALTVNALEALTSSTAQFFLKNGATVRGVLSYVGGNANDQLALEGSVFGKTAIKLGNGNNTVTSQTAYRTASLSIVGGIGPDAVALSGEFNTTAVGGTTAIALGNGNNSVSTSNLRVGGAFKVTGGVNNDSLLISGGLFGGVIQPTLGDGNNSVTVSNNAIVGGGLKVTTGLGNDTVNVAQSSILGATRLALGAGINIFGNQGGGTQYEGGLTYVGLGGTDLVTLGGATVKGVLSISTGEGDSTVNLFGTAVHGATQLKGGNVGTDNIVIDATANLSGALTIYAGNGSNGTTLSGMSNITTLTYNGGNSSDGFQIVNNGNIPGGGLFTRATVKLGAGTDSFSFAGSNFLSFKVDGGADADQVLGTIPSGLLAVNFETGV